MSDQSNEQMNEEPRRSRVFNPNSHLIQLKSREGSKDYLPVQWRLVWFREQCPHGTIDTEELIVDLDREVEEEVFVWNNEKRRSEKSVKQARGYARFKAVVTDGKGGRATGTKSENAASFPDYIEKAETGAIGRALAALGYGTQFAPDLDEAHRIVDSPVERHSAPTNGNGHSNNGNPPLAPIHSNAVRSAQNGNSAPTSTISTTATAEPGAESMISEQQLSSIRKLCEHLGKAEPENVTTLSFLGARKTLQQLTTEYKEFKQNNKAS